MMPMIERGLTPPKPNATVQWEFTSVVNGSLTLDQRCSQCHRDDLHVTFEVRQTVAEAIYDVCEHCLGKGLAPVQENGRTLYGRELRHHLNQMAVRAKVRTCRAVFRYLLTTTSDGGLSEIAVYFDRHATLSPRHAATLFLAISSARLDADPRIFEVHTRSVDHKEEFGRLSEPEKLSVWQVLSFTVRKRLIALGLAPKRYALQQGKRTKPSGRQANAADCERHGLQL